MPEAQDQALVMLRRAYGEHRAAVDELDRAVEKRDVAIADAAAVGLSRRAIATASGLTPGRIQQILDKVAGDKKHAYWRWLARKQADAAEPS